MIPKIPAKILLCLIYSVYWVFLAIYNTVTGLSSFIYYFLISTAYAGRESDYLASVKLGKLPLHLCIVIQPNETTSDSKLLYIMNWSRSINLPMVSTFSNGTLRHWGHDVQTTSSIDALLNITNTNLTKLSLTETLEAHQTKHAYPDLIVSIGKSAYMPMGGLTPTYLTYAEIVYGGRMWSLDVFGFVEILREFAVVEQRCGK
jgi:hypothetical protein